MDFISNVSIATALNKISVETTSRSYRLENLLLVGIDNIELNYENTDNQIISATFIADYVVKEFPIDSLITDTVIRL